jgi:hypothetical protein
MDQEQEIQAARDKLAARFSNATQIGGKGKTREGTLLSNDTNKIFTHAVYRHPEKKEEAC